MLDVKREGDIKINTSKSAFIKEKELIFVNDTVFKFIERVVNYSDTSKIIQKDSTVVVEEEKTETKTKIEENQKTNKKIKRALIISILLNLLAIRFIWKKR